MFLAGHAAHVTLLARRPLNETMSAYLVERIAGLLNVEVVTGVEISRLEGEDHALSAIAWRDRRGEAETRRPVRHLFLFIGADPNTDWLGGSGLRLDPSGFILTGSEARTGALPLETAAGRVPVGDVMAQSVKPVARRSATAPRSSPSTRLSSQSRP